MFFYECVLWNAVSICIRVCKQVVDKAFTRLMLGTGRPQCLVCSTHRGTVVCYTLLHIPGC